MGGYLSTQAEIRKIRPLIEIYVKVDEFHYEYIYKHDNILEPHSGNIDKEETVNINKEIVGIIKALDYLPNLGIEFDKVIIYTSPKAIAEISNILYHRTHDKIVSHFADQNIEMTEFS